MGAAATVEGPLAIGLSIIGTASLVLASVGTPRFWPGAPLSAQQQAGSTAALIGLRATWAARSGIEWALHEAVATGDCPGASTLLNLSEGVLAGFDVTVRCTSTRHFEGSDERVSLSIRSEATFGTLGTRDFTYRQRSAAAVL